MTRHGGAWVVVVVVLVAATACSGGVVEDDQAAETSAQESTTAPEAPTPVETAPTAAPSAEPAATAGPTPAPETPLAPGQSVLGRRVVATRTVQAQVAGVDLSWLTLPAAPAYEEYVPLVDETGLITVDVPATWTDVDTAQDEADGVAIPSIWAAPSLEAFLGTWDEPGVTIDVRESTDVDGLLTALADSVGAAEDCGPGETSDYDDGSYVGTAVLYPGCGGSAASLQVVAGPPGFDVLFSVQVQLTTSADVDAAFEVIRSFAYTVPEGEISTGQAGEAGGIDFSWLSLPAGVALGSYDQLTDDLGALQVAVPTEWADVDGSPDTIEDGEVPSLWAAPSLSSYLEGWSAPGLQLDLRPVSVLREGEVQALANEVGAEEACAETRSYDYFDGAYTGAAALYAECGSAGSAYLIIGAGVPEADGMMGQFFVLRMVIAASSDIGVAVEVVRSFHRIDRTPAAPTGDGGSLEDQAVDAVDYVLGTMAYACDHVPQWTNVLDSGPGLFTVEVGIDDGGSEVVLTYLVDIDALYGGAVEPVITDADTITTSYCPLS